MHVRPITPEDADHLVAFDARLSPETVYLRFFTAKPTLSPEQAERFACVDHEHRVALVAELGDLLVAVARYDREIGTDSAEVAFVVSDDHQGRGIGTILLEHLASAARENGITRFVAETLPGNGGCWTSSAPQASKRTQPCQATRNTGRTGTAPRTTASASAAIDQPTI